MGRFAAPSSGLGFWLALWALAIAAEFAALVPVFFPGERARRDRAGDLSPHRRIIRGVRAHRLAPAARQPQRPAHGRGGRGLLRAPLIGQFDSSLAQTASILLQELWAPFFVALVLTLLTGGRLAVATSTGCWSARSCSRCWILQLVWLLFYEQDGNLLAVFPERRHRRRGRQGPALAGRPGLRRASRSSSLCDGGRVAAAAARPAAERRGQRRAAALRRPADQRPRDRLALADGPVARDRLARQRAGGVPVRAAALAAGPRRPGGPLPRPQSQRAAASCRPRWRRTLGDPSLVVAYRLPGSRATPTPTAAGARARRSPTDRWRHRRERRRRGRGARLRRLARRRSRADRGGARRTGIALENERLHAEAEARAGRGAGLARAHRRGGRRRAPAAGAQPPRRRPAAPGRALAAAAPPPGPGARRPVGAEQLVATASAQLAQSLAELRELARGIHPAVLDHGLDAALDSLAARSHRPHHRSPTRRPARCPSPSSSRPTSSPPRP